MSGFRYCFGPVGSWRLGVSLGIDPVSRPGKVCTFDCVYCQLGSSDPSPPERGVYVKPGELREELERITAPADYVTFSGAAEPTLAANLTELLLECRRVRRDRTAILTNSSMMYSGKIREDLGSFDLVIAKLDAPDEKIFEAVNRPHAGVNFREVLKGLDLFSRSRRGRLALQTMFVGANKSSARGLARLYAEIGPDEVQLNTPLRPCAEKPLSREEMEACVSGVKDELGKLGAAGIKVVSVYDEKAPKVEPVSAPDTLRRRGKI